MTRRIVTGAHYGLRDWLAQRITAAIMAIYSLIILFAFMSGKPITYGVWRDLFAQGWMRVATLLFAASLAWTEGLLALFVRVLWLPPLPAKALAEGIAVTFNFLALKHFAFRASRPA